jgi:hypothetical protein
MTEQRVFVLVCASSLTFSAIMIWRARLHIQGRTAFLLVDDAMISMTYARNLAHGNGLVWYAGGPRVEGITNPLWTGWMAVLHLLPVGEFRQSLLVMISGALLLLLLLWLVRCLARRVEPEDPVVATYAVVLTATFYPLLFWTIGGMEVAVVAILFAGALFVVLRIVDAVGAGPSMRVIRRDVVMFGGVALLAIATRVDAVVGLAALAGAASLLVPKGRRRGVALILAAPVVSAFAVVTAARLAYYGDPLPNTYYLKATGIPLDIQLAAGARHFVVAMWSHLAAFGLVCAAGFWRNPSRWARLCAALVVTQAVYSVWVGGDYWETQLIANRYLSVAIAPAALLAAVGIRRLSLAPRQFAVVLGALAAALVLGLAVARSKFAFSVPELLWQRMVLRQEANDYWWAYLGVVAGLLVVAVALLRPRTNAGRRTRPGWLGAGLLVLVIGLTNVRAVAHWNSHPDLGDGGVNMASGLAIRETTTPDASVAVLMAGVAPYFAQRPAVDLLGKSDKHIARLSVPDAKSFWAGHNKSDLRWSIDHWKPDLVYLGLWDLDSSVQNVMNQSGYHHLALDIWVRDDTDKVDVAGLTVRLEEIAKHHNADLAEVLPPA